MNTRRLLTSWHLWVMVALVIGFLLLQKSFDASTLFILAIVLLCPIMMMFMMGGKGHKY